LFRFTARGGFVAGRRRLPRSATIAFIFALCAVFVGDDLLRTWEARTRALEQSRREVENLTWSASQQAEGTFRTVGAILLGLVERVEVDGTDRGQIERLRSLMTQRLASLPLLEDLILVDASGVAVVDGKPTTPRIALGDRAYFQYHRAHSDVEMYIGSPVRSRLTGRWIIPVSRRLNHADGSFGGIVIATVESGYFQDFFATFNLGHDGVAALWRDNGVPLVRQSLVVPVIDRGPHSNDPRPFLFPAAASGSYELVSPTDGVTRIVSYRRLAGYPLVVHMALGKGEQLADWRAAAVGHLLAAVVVTLLLGFIGAGLMAQSKLAARADRANALAAAANNENLLRLSRHLAKARDRAEQANQAKSRFLAGMSHELRTPLNGILGYARLLRMDGGLNPIQGARVDAMLGAGKHLLEMVNYVLDLSQIEAGHLELRPVRFDIQALAAACLDQVRPAAEAKGLTLTIAVAPGTPRALFNDPTRLRQVLLNLLGNAAKFTSQGAIEMRLQPAAEQKAVRIEVTDTGPGIPAEQRQRLFQEFERLDAEATAKVEGAGLGLALSSRLVAMMGGRLRHDDNPGGGSIFWLELPLTTGAAADRLMALTPEVADVEPEQRPTKVLNVLVVDDVAMNRDIARSFLHAFGHRVTCAEGGAESVAAVANADFDVVLMDVRMPGVDGLEATRRIRALEGVRGRVPIVALTAQVFTEQVAQCRDAGMDSHLVKPYDADILFDALVQATTVTHSETVLPVSTPTTAPAAGLIPVIGAELTVLDRAVFERTAAYLSPEAVASYLETITQLGADLLHALQPVRVGSSPGKRLAEEAHTLAGSAGMFGFERLAAMGRRFERDVESGVRTDPALADGLIAAIEATLQAIRDR